MISELIGKTITSIEGLVKDSDLVTISCADGTKYKMYHRQDCCESVEIEDVTGDVEDLLNSPIVRAEESSSNDKQSATSKYQYDSFTWTFYRIATAKGLVVIRWYGSSNGYYSESVDFERVLQD